MDKDKKVMKWYLSMWFIGLCFALSFLIIPLFVGISLVKKRAIIEREDRSVWESRTLGQIAKLQKEKEWIEQSFRKKMMDQENSVEALKAEALAEKAKIEAEVAERKQEIVVEMAVLEEKQHALQAEVQQVENKVNIQRDALLRIEGESMSQSMGLYHPQFNEDEHPTFARNFDEIRTKQEALITGGTAVLNNATEELSEEASNHMVSNMRIALRSFNQECYILVLNATAHNADDLTARLQASYDHLNELNDHNKIAIHPEYLNLKVEELRLASAFKEELEQMQGYQNKEKVDKIG